MNESILLPVYINDIQAGFKYAIICMDDFKTAECRKALNKIFFYKFKPIRRHIYPIFSKRDKECSVAFSCTILLRANNVYMDQC
jgi:hypothetical protein